MERKLAFLVILLLSVIYVFGQSFTLNDTAFLRPNTSSSSIQGAIAWYAGNAGGFTNDLSGKGHNLVDTSPGHILQTNQINGLPAMLFPAASGSLFRSDITNAQPYTIFLVIQAVPDLGGGFPFETINPQQQFRLGFFSINAGSDLNSLTLFPTANYNYITSTYSNSLSYIRQNGVDVANGSAGTGSIDSQSIGAVVPFDIHIAEWIICTNISRLQVTNNELNLKNKYGL